jgi:hypothetical protein
VQRSITVLGGRGVMIWSATNFSHQTQKCILSCSLSSSRDGFQNSLIAGEKGVVHHVLGYITSKQKVHRTRAYLARYLVKVNVPPDILQEEEVARVHEKVGHSCCHLWLICPPSVLFFVEGTGGEGGACLWTFMHLFSESVREWPITFSQLKEGNYGGVGRAVD